MSHDDSTPAHGLPANNVPCGHDAYLRFTWPGKNEKYACTCCAAQLKRVSDAMGFPLQFISTPDTRPCECLRPPYASR